MTRIISSVGSGRARAVDVLDTTAVEYLDWPLGLGDPTGRTVTLDDVAPRANTCATSSKELVVGSHTQRLRVAKSSGSGARVSPSPTVQNSANLELPNRRCSSQVQCHRALATKKCLSCVKFDELKVGYYCDACFTARHPAYRLNHSWIRIEDDLTDDHERIYHFIRLKLDEDIRELELLVTKTHDFLARPHCVASRATARPSTVSQISTHDPESSNAIPHNAVSTASPRRTAPPPPHPLNALHTPTGDLDFDATRNTIAAIQTTLRGLIEQVRTELARKEPLTRHEALVKIQRMWKIRSARKQLTALVRSVYARFEDPVTGATYYYNRTTHTTQWTKPAAFGDDDSDQFSSNSSNSKCVTRQHDRKASVPATRVFSSRAEEEADAAQRIQGMARAHRARAYMRKLISSMYEKIWDAARERFYYHNTRTKEVAWERPRWVRDADLLTPRTRQQRVDDDAKQQRLTLLRATVTQDQAATMLQRAYRRKKGFEALLARCRLVYERIFDPSQNAYYYHNTRTNETTWTKPAILRHAKADVLTPRSRLAQALAAARAQSHTKREWTDEQAAVCLQGLYRARLAKRMLDARLTQTFRKVWDADANRFYYVDLRTQAVSWEPPALLLRSGVDVDEFE